MKTILTIQTFNLFKTSSIRIEFIKIKNEQNIDQAIQALQQLKNEKIVTKHFKIPKKCKQK